MYIRFSQVCIGYHEMLPYAWCRQGTSHVPGRVRGSGGAEGLLSRLDTLLMDIEHAGSIKLWGAGDAIWAILLDSAGQLRRCAGTLSARAPDVQVVECGGARVLQFEPRSGRQDSLTAQVPACSVGSGRIA